MIQDRGKWRPVVAMVKELGEISSLLEELLATQRLCSMEIVAKSFVR